MNVTKTDSSLCNVDVHIFPARNICNKTSLNCVQLMGAHTSYMSMSMYDTHDWRSHWFPHRHSYRLRHLNLAWLSSIAVRIACRNCGCDGGRRAIIWVDGSGSNDGYHGLCHHRYCLGHWLRHHMLLLLRCIDWPTKRIGGRWRQMILVGWWHPLWQP